MIASSHPKNRLLKSEAIVVECAKSGAEGADDRNDKRETHSQGSLGKAQDAVKCFEFLVLFPHRFLNVKKY